MRQIILDTETTGIDYRSGHRLIEIGCIEMQKRRFTGNNLHFYVNPERAIEQGAIDVHGITNEFLIDKPVFADIAEEVMQYLKGAELVIHNAPFDVGFLNNELKLLPNNHWQSLEAHCTILDTLVMARKLHSGQRNSLDALCKRYDVSNHHRQLHGALLDAELLGQVYLAMTGGQTRLSFDQPVVQASQHAIDAASDQVKTDKLDFIVAHASGEEQALHEAYLKKLDAALWSEG